MNNLLKKCLKGITAFAIALGVVQLPNAVLTVNASTTDGYEVSEYTPIDEVVLENSGGDGFYYIDSFPSATNFTYSADMLFETIDNDAKSAALVYGIKEANMHDDHAIKSNVNAEGGDVIGRTWSGYGCEGYGSFANLPSGNTDLTKKFRMIVTVQDRVMTHTVYNIDDNGNAIANTTTTVGGALYESYNGGTFGLMVHRSKVHVNNITLETEGQTYNYVSSGTVKVGNPTGDGFYRLETLPSATTFEYSADVQIVTTPGYWNKQSVALIVGMNPYNNDGVKANVNGADYDPWGRVWEDGVADSYGNTPAKLTGQPRNTDLSKKIRLNVKVEENANNDGYELTYWVYNIDGDGNEISGTRTTATDKFTLSSNYDGGMFGLMAWGSEAIFSNITMKTGDTTYVYGAEYEDTSNVFEVKGQNGDTHLVMSDPNVVTTDFVYETDVVLNDGPSAALSFAIQDPDNPAVAWCGANFNFNDNNARIFSAGGNKTVSGENATTGLSDVIERNEAIHMKLTVNTNGLATLTLNNVGEDEEFVATAQLEGYTGGHLGLVTYNSSAEFTNTTIALGNNFEIVNSTDFKNVGTSEFNVNKENDTVTIGEVDGDHFSMFSIPVKTNAFTMEADVEFTDTDDVHSAGLMFGTSGSAAPGDPWYAANVDTSRANAGDCFRVFGAGKDFLGSTKGNIDLTRPLHLKLVMDADGNYTYTFGNTDGSASNTITGTIPNWNGGYLGLLTWKAGAVFSNIRVVNNNTVKTVTTTPLTNDGNWKTNLTDLSYDNGTWTIDGNGLTSNAKDKGDAFLLTETTGSNFVYSTNLKFNEVGGAAGLVFRSENDLIEKEAYAVNVSETDTAAKVKFWRWYRNDDYQLIDEKTITKADSYELKVVAYDTWIMYYVNDVLVASTGDYNLQYGDLGQPTVLKSGYFGLVNWNGNVTYQNTYFTALDDAFNPVLDDITITSSTGTVEAKGNFYTEEPTMIQYVKNDATTVNVATTSAYGSTIKVKVGDTEYTNGKDIPVKEGKNIITVESTDTKDGVTATAVYHVNVHRLQKDEVYYNELYRDQYHYSVREGWANDPNGMIYDSENDVYHLFYQFYDDTTWGPMHWAHATSKDLLTWEEKPIALYPDANGTQFSGCMVNDTENTSGLFESAGSTNFVALITDNGNGQRIKVAYSTDGDNWTKVDEIAADWSDDPLANRDFRDPKVFRWEGKWFMVIAGGPLRIYSSDDLLSWKCESAYADLHTECPDMYPIMVDEDLNSNGIADDIKWVLSRGGRYYKVGDFKVVNGDWTFVPDADYVNSDGVMNFGKDSYAAMTYYDQDFGTAANPTIPEIIEINWMNTWEGEFCRGVANTVGQEFNGTFNLNLSLGLVKDGNKYVLTQTPITKTSEHGGYEELRGETLVNTNGYVSVDENNTLLDALSDDTYEIVAKFKPGSDTTKVGFALREAGDQKTVVLYDVNTKEITIDRSKSSSYFTGGMYVNNMSQKVVENTDGSIDFHIYVDKASVEVFMEGYTVAGAAQIFPDPTSLGASVLVEGGAAEVDLTVYDVKSIWEGKKVEVTKPLSINTTNNDFYCLDVNETVELSAIVLPIELSQELTWELVDGEGVVSFTTSNNKATVKAIKDGVATIKATSALDETLSKTFTVKVHANAFDRDMFENSLGDAGNFVVDSEGVLTITDPCQNSTLMSKETVATDFVLDADLAYTRGMVNVFFSSDVANPTTSKAYAIQFDNARNVVRLFRFDIGGDTAVAELPNGVAVNDGEFFHVTIEKSGMTLKVYVNDTLCLTHTYTDVVEYFKNPAKVGVGVWDGAVSVKNFVVNTREVTKLPGDNYTTNSYAAYEELVDQVATVEASKLAALLKDVKVAENALVNVASLKEVIDRVDSTDTDLYTEETVNAFIIAYNNACAALINGTDASVEAAEKTLVDAYNALEEKTTSQPEDEGTTPPSEGSNTGDTTNVAGLLTMLLASAYIISRRKRA